MSPFAKALIPVLWLAAAAFWTRPLSAASPANLAAARSATGAEAAATNGLAADPAQAEFDHLLEMDQTAMEAAELEAKTSGATLKLRVEQKLLPVEKAYQDFISRHPSHVDVRLAYGSFLDDFGTMLGDSDKETEAVAQWEKARELDPKNPATWDNLAGYYAHEGPVLKAFEYYDKAIELSPNEPAYHQNLAIVIFLYRKDARDYYRLDESGVFDRSLKLYREAIKLDPKNLPLATEYAQTFYGITPLRTQEALQAWNYALNLAGDDSTKQGIYLHLARVELNSGLFAAASNHLASVTLPVYDDLKKLLLSNLQKKQTVGLGNPTTTPPVRPNGPDIR